MQVQTKKTVNITLTLEFCTEEVKVLHSLSNTSRSGLVNAGVSEECAKLLHAIYRQVDDALHQDI